MLLKRAPAPSDRRRPVARPRATRAVFAIVVGVLALITSACRVDVTVDVVARPDGSGTVTVTAVADAELVAAAPGLAEDLRLDDATATGWAVTGPTPTADGGLEVVLTRPFTGPDEANAILAQLNGPDGPLTGLQLTRLVDGDDVRHEVTGTLLLASGLAAFTDAELLGLVGDASLAAVDPTLDVADTIGVTLTVTLPGSRGDTTGETEGATDADGADIGTTHTWVLDPAATVEVSAVGEQLAADQQRAGTLATVMVVLIVVWLVLSGAFAVYVLRARRARRR
jgi:hypothetical protein